MENAFDTWSPDREIVVVKLLNHSRAKVFAAWMDPDALAAWYGPTGTEYRNPRGGYSRRRPLALRHGGHFEGHERRFPNLMRFIEIVPKERIVMDYGTRDPDDPDRFRMMVTFDEQGDGKTVLTLRQLHPTRARRQVVVGFGAVEYGLQTLAGLAAWLDG